MSKLDVKPANIEICSGNMNDYPVELLPFLPKYLKRNLTSIWALSQLSAVNHCNSNRLPGPNSW